MALVRWQPFHELEDIQARLNRLFSGMGLSTSRDESVSFTAWAPAVDIEESDKEYLVKADLPEVKKEDVKVTVEEGVLTIEGERRQEKEEKNKRFHKIERAYGKFVRRFELPAEVDGAKVQADFKEGVLNVHLPKSPSGTPKTIQVKVN
jgi:HSP20 family protein